PRKAFGLDVIDAVGAGDRPLELGRDVAANRVGARAEVDRADHDNRAVAAGVLPGVELEVGNDAHDQNRDVHDKGDNGLADEEIGETAIKHGGSARSAVGRLPAACSGRCGGTQELTGFGDGSLEGVTSLLIWTGAALRSLKIPDVATRSPGSRPSVTAIRSPRFVPSLTGC